MIRLRKARSASVDEWIRNMANIRSHIYNATLKREVISKGFKKKKFRCFSCGKKGHLKRDCRQNQANS